MTTLAVAVSGGPDSVFLLRRLARIWRPGRPRIVVLSVDHGVRGAASAEDLAFVARLAAELSLPFRALRADLERVLKDGRASEQRLRAERYRLLSQALQEFRAGALYLAHQRDDQVETIVLAALRGAGLKGLSGMPRRRWLREPDRSATLVRPLLAVSRSAIEESLLGEAAPSRDDATNRDLDFARNRVRHVVLPLLRRALGDSLDGRLLKLARVARVLRWRAERGARREGSIANGSDALHALFESLVGFSLARGISMDLQRAFVRSRCVVVDVGRGVRLEVGKQHAERVEAKAPSPPRASAIGFAEFARPGAAARLLAAIRRAPPHSLREHFDRRRVLYLDADRIDGPLTVRTRRPGDRFQPLGKPVPVKTKDLLIAAKIARERRAELRVLEDSLGILGVEGLPPAARAALSSATRRILRIRFHACDETRP